MLADPENAFGFACRRLLFPGALGLLVASILAASMSACSAYMVDVGALFTEQNVREFAQSGGRFARPVERGIGEGLRGDPPGSTDASPFQHKTRGSGASLHRRSDEDRLAGL